MTPKLIFKQLHFDAHNHLKLRNFVAQQQKKSQLTPCGTLDYLAY